MDRPGELQSYESRSPQCKGLARKFQPSRRVIQRGPYSHVTIEEGDKPGERGDHLSESGDHPTRLEDVATIEDGAEDESSYASYDGKRAVVLSIRKQSGANTVTVVDSVKERLGEVQRTLPEGARIEIVRDNSQTIRTSVHAVQEHLIVGALLAAVVVLLFLGSARSTLIAAIAIPVSIVGAFAFMYVFDFTLNMMTLLALRSPSAS